MQNFYQLFGTSNFASVDEIQKAFNKLYADLFSSESPLANIPRLKELKDAFDLLTNPEKRAEYDVQLKDFLDKLEKQFESAVSALSNGNNEEAIALLRECIRVNPREPDYYESIGLAYQLSKQYDEAVKCFQQGLQTNTKNALFHWYIGDLFLIIRENDKADTHFLDAAEGFKEILKVDPKNLQAQELLADTYAKMKWYDESLEVYQQLLEQYPFRAEYHRDVGSVLYELELYDDAEDHLLEALRNAPGDSSALLFLGLVYFKRRLLTLAVQTLEDSLKRNPDQPEVVQLIEKIKEVQKDIGSTVEEIVHDPDPIAVVEGTVKWFNSETGLGVLSSPEYPEVLLHFRAIKPEDQEKLTKGDAVRFGVVKDKVGPVAVQVERLDGAELSDTLLGTIIKFDSKLRIGAIKTSLGREIVFYFSSLSKELLEAILPAQNVPTPPPGEGSKDKPEERPDSALTKSVLDREVLFELKTTLGLADEPIEQAINIRFRKKKNPPKPPEK